MTGPEPKGPLAGLTVIEMAGLGPAPLAGLMLSEMGARVLRIERVNEASFMGLGGPFDFNRHGRSVIQVDMKRPGAAPLVLSLAAGADLLIEGFRPGVMERLGIGPEPCLERNQRLIYGRITGFGQDGPLARQAGHDLTYIAYAGVLHAIGHKGERPTPPLNLVGDYGGGTMFLLTGLLAALVERASSGKGQVVDASMIEGASMLALPSYAYHHAGLWRGGRGENLLDSGAPFYDTYEAADGKFVAVACLEPQFFAEFAAALSLDERFVAGQYDKVLWPELHDAISSRIKQRSRDDWADMFAETDACVAPVLDFDEAAAHPHNVTRASHVGVDGFKRPAPAPKLSRTPLQLAGPAHRRDPVAALTAFGVSDAGALVQAGLVR